MFFNVVRRSIFGTGCSYPYSCFCLRWNRLRSVNGNMEKISKCCYHSSLLRRAVTVNMAPSGILSTVETGFIPCVYRKEEAAEFSTYKRPSKKYYNQRESPSVLSDESKVYNILNECQDILRTGMRTKERVDGLIEMIDLQNTKVEIHHLVHILYYILILNIRNEEVLVGLSKKIIDSLDKCTSPGTLIKSYLNSLRIGLIRDPDDLDKLLLWLRSQDMDLNIMVVLVHTLAFLDYFPQTADIILQRIGKRKIEEFPSKVRYFELVWSLVLLNRAEEEMIQNVLNYDFWKKLEYSSLRGKEGNFLKIMNIYAFAKTRKFSISPDMKWVPNNTAWMTRAKNLKSTVADSQQVVNVVTHFLPLNSYSFYVFSDCGLIIDAVCYLDINCRPITESAFMKEKEAIKLAILTTSFDNYCFPGKKTPAGLLKFYKAQLEENGYKTLFLRFNFFPASSSLEEKFKYLNKGIQSVLPDFDIHESPSNRSAQKGRES